MAGSGTRSSSADPHDPLDEEDHQGDGAGRDEPHRQGPGAGGGVAAVLHRHHRRADGAGQQRQHQPSAAAGRGRSVRRAGVLVITSDRGLCGGYNANAIRTAEQLISRLREEGKQVMLYVVGRKGVTLLPVPRPADRGELDRLLRAAHVRRRAGDRRDAHRGVRGRSRRRRRRDGPSRWGRRRARRGRAAHRAHPVPLADDPDAGGELPRPDAGRGGRGGRARGGILPAYEFEPEPDALLDALLPKYINTRIYAALIDAAASESAARRRAMKAPRTTRTT